MYFVVSVKDGIFRQYRGARDKDSFITFIEDKKWSSIEPVSGKVKGFHTFENAYVSFLNCFAKKSWIEKLVNHIVCNSPVRSNVSIRHTYI